MLQPLNKELMLYENRTGLNPLKPRLWKKERAILGAEWYTVYFPLLKGMFPDYEDGTHGPVSIAQREHTHRGRKYPVANFAGVSITEHLTRKCATEHWYYIGDERAQHRAIADLGGVPNDRVLVLPLRVGKWKEKGGNFAIEVCRVCGEKIRLKDEYAAFYQGDIRFSMPHKMCTALITYDELKYR